MESIVEFTARLARQAGDLLAGFFSPFGVQSSLKDDYSVVTEADLAADRMIAAAILDRFPEDQILSEELNPGLAIESSRAIWVVDPLDGTTNFSLGMQTWGVSIARLEAGLPVVAVLYFPLLKEFYQAERGRGASLNGKRLQIGEPAVHRNAAFFSCCSRTFRRYQVDIPYKPRIFGSAAYSFCALTRGAALLSFDATPKIWDIAGVWLLVEEAGGTIGPFDNLHPLPLRLGLDYSHQIFTTLAAANSELEMQARSQIRLKPCRSAG